MIQTENTAIVLRHVNYRDNDRMVTLLSPSRGRIDAIIRNCRKPKSHNLNAGELFALGDYMLHENGGHVTVTSVRLIETFYPLSSDYDRLTCGIWLLNLAEAVAEPEQEQQELFMLLLHTLSRLTFSDQEWKPLLAGFLLHFSACQGFKPRLNHCVFCGEKLKEEGPFFFDAEEGGVSDAADAGPGPLDAERADHRFSSVGQYAGDDGALYRTEGLRGTTARPADQELRDAAEGLEGRRQLGRTVAAPGAKRRSRSV